MAARQTNQRQDPISVNATITDAVKEDDTVYYEMSVNASYAGANGAQAEWVIRKRYSEFEALKKVLEKAGATVKNFPEKKMFGSNNDDVIEERKAGLGEFLSTYVLPRAHCAAEGEFLDVKTYVRYSCEVTDTAGEGDNITYEITTTLEFSPGQPEEEVVRSELVLEQSAAVIEAVASSLAAKFELDLEAAMAHLKEDGVDSKVAEQLEEFERQSKQKEAEQGADAEQADEGAEAEAAAEEEPKLTATVGRSWVVHKTHNQFDMLKEDLVQGDLRTAGVQIDAFPDKGASAEDFTAFLTEYVMENLDKSCVAPFLWATEVAL